MLRLLLIAGAVLCLALLAVAAIGYLLPVDHVAARSATFNQPPERVYAALVDVERYPRWRSDVSAVEVLPGGPARRWRERGANGTITFEVVESRPLTRLVTRIADTELAFGGSWTFDLAPGPRGTQVTLTERGQVFNPIFRFLSRFVFGHTATMERFLADLGRHLG